MASVEGDTDPEWVKKLKYNGAVPLLDLDNCPNGWASPPGDCFRVRGPDYLTTKTKISGGDWLLKPLAFDWLKGSAKIHEVLKHPNGRVKRALEEACKNCESDKKPFVWAFNLQVPSKDNHTAVAYFYTFDPIPEGSLMDQFLKGDDAFRNSRLKLIANIVKGPWIVRTAVGEQAICILGRAVSCKYSQGENFIEVDVDIGASMIANAIVHLAFGYITSLTVDLAFLIESQTEAELPERILGAVRFSELDPASAKPVDHDASMENGESSLPTGFWKSIGQGFSHLLHPNAVDGTVPGLPHVNGVDSLHVNGTDNNKENEVDYPHVNGVDHNEEDNSEKEDDSEKIS
uniref:Protein ENHANCED DISEASE RESISTANCE 2 C-terminal domain-containing protein n=1 Tax=Araucaria cunninghamii TaxID=56994 RepID=A0A0D6QXX6_ARACU